MLNAEQGERFLPDIHFVEERYQDRWVNNMLSDYFWRSKQDVRTLSHTKKAFKCHFMSKFTLLLLCI